MFVAWFRRSCRSCGCGGELVDGSTLRGRHDVGHCAVNAKARRHETELSFDGFAAAFVACSCRYNLVTVMLWLRKYVEDRPTCWFQFSASLECGVLCWTRHRLRCWTTTPLLDDVSCCVLRSWTLVSIASGQELGELGHLHTNVTIALENG